jgi:ATP-dependent Clp protease ATP-binding subunit ClpC
MSEYMERFAVSRLVGAPPGYVGYEEGGQLTEAVRRNPFSVVLLDEIEKAHPEVFNILLQVMEDGRLTDSQGRIVDFKNVILIMTSNVGARQIMGDREMGFAREGRGNTFNYESMKNRVQDELKRVFRPEFLNRVDETIVFHPLNHEEILQIVDLMMIRVQKQIAQRGMDFEVTPAVKELIAKEGFDQQYGARPLRRAVQRLIEDPLSEQFLLGKFEANDTVLLEIDPEDAERVVFRKGAPLDIDKLPTPDDEMPEVPLLSAPPERKSRSKGTSAPESSSAEN